MSVRYDDAMSALAEPKRMSYAQYREGELEARIKHEYLRGEVFAMTGGSPLHGALAMRIGAILTRELSGRPCRVFSSDVRVRIEATDLSTYPDVSVVCGALETSAQDDHAIVNPTLVVEVLSPSTEGYDRGEKARHYRRIPSLRAYLMVSQEQTQLDLVVKRSDGEWVLLDAGAGESLAIEPLGVSLRVDEVYEDPLAAGR